MYNTNTMKNFTVIIILTIILGSCATAPRMADTDIRYQKEPEIIEQSLFSSKDKTISEDDIRRLLDGKIVIQDSLRVALFNYSFHSRGNSYFNYYYPWNDEEFLKTQQDYITTLTSGIEESEKVDKIILMPSIMANEKSSITNLRETAIRLQADFLLVYSIKSDIYYKYKAFSADETKAFATVETFLMDSRTGVIPFTTIVTKESFLKKSSNEMTTEELRKKAEKMAVVDALSEIGIQLSEFLNNY